MELPPNPADGIISLLPREASTIEFGPNVDPFLMPLEMIAIYSFLTKTKSNFAVGEPISSFELNFQTLSQESQGHEAVQHQQDI